MVVCRHQTSQPSKRHTLNMEFFLHLVRKFQFTGPPVSTVVWSSSVFDHLSTSHPLTFRDLLLEEKDTQNVGLRFFFHQGPRWKVASFLLAGGGQLQLRCFGGAHGSCSVPCLAHKKEGGDRDGHGRHWEMGDGGTILD